MRLHRIAVLVATAGVVSIAAASQGQAGGGTPITQCGQLVTTSAFLTENLECPGVHGVVAFASGITIDLRGFRLRGDRTPGRYGIYVPGFDRVTIKNGVLNNFEFGVAALNDAEALSVSKLVASGNSADGITVSGASAKIVSSAGTGNAAGGIEVAGGSARIQSSTAHGNGGHGIFVNGDSAIIKSATAAGNGGFGIFVVGAPARIQASTASGNAAGGIEVSGSTPLLKGNRADGNGFAGGVSDLGGYGIMVVPLTPFLAGTNVAGGNDNPAECKPTTLC